MDGGHGDSGDRAILSRVADRVRGGRKRLGLTRKALAETSGVSERYLAELEAGRGNISLVLLARVATALATPLPDLIAGEEEADLLARFRRAPPERRAAAMAALAATAPVDRADRISLIGLRGAGKSTLGPRLAQRLDMPFVELSAEIEAEAGLPVGEVIAFYGQEGYRQLERQALERVVSDHDRLVLAVAGGIVGEADTFQRLLAKTHAIWLKAAPEDHMGRVRRQGDERPMAGRPKAMDELLGILRRREALYAQAEAEVETSGQSIDAAAEAAEAVALKLLAAG